MSLILLAIASLFPAAAAAQDAPARFVPGPGRADARRGAPGHGAVPRRRRRPRRGLHPRSVRHLRDGRHDGPAGGAGRDGRALLPPRSAGHHRAAGATRRRQRHPHGLPHAGHPDLRAAGGRVDGAGGGGEPGVRQELARARPGGAADVPRRALRHDDRRPGDGDRRGAHVRAALRSPRVDLSRQPERRLHALQPGGDVRASQGRATHPGHTSQ